MSASPTFRQIRQITMAGAKMLQVYTWHILGPAQDVYQTVGLIDITSWPF